MNIVFSILSFLITLTLVLLGAFVFSKSYLRFGEGFIDLLNSIKFYFCRVFNIDATHRLTVLDFTKIFDEVVEPITPSPSPTPMPLPSPSPTPIPPTIDGFEEEVVSFWDLFIDSNNFNGYLSSISDGLLIFSKILVILVPILIVLFLLIKKGYEMPNNNYNVDSLPLKVFKLVSKYTYVPIKKFVLMYYNYLKSYKMIYYLWIVLLIFNLNIATILIEFLAFYFYFAMSFDFKSIYTQLVKFTVDFKVVIDHFTWWILLPFGLFLFNKFRKKYALNLLNHFEAKNCGFINDLPIVSMTCGSMGKKKTTVITDMSLSQEVMFRQKAFDIIKKTDMKFPNFPWISFENELKKCMEYKTVYNLASIKKWVRLKQSRFEKHLDSNLQLYGYDLSKYPLYFDDKLSPNYLFDVLINYAQAYFIYVIQSSLLVSNYAIRGENKFVSYDNFPVWQNDFFPEKYQDCDRFSHILDFDVLRLGKKLIEDNKNIGSFEFGVVTITEIGKERGNNLELKEVKKTTDLTNQKNDLFNSWLKMCRHSATVDNYPFIKVFTDEQRPESWGADARDLAEIITILKSGETKIALPFYTLEEMIYDWCFNKFIKFYYHFRLLRGDNLLLIHLLKMVVSKIFNYHIRIMNQYGYCVLKVQIEDGKERDVVKKNKYYIMNKKIYSRRFSTDCFSDYFNDIANKTNVGLNDYVEYATEKASVEELKEQNSYFINSLYSEK